MKIKILNKQLKDNSVLVHTIIGILAGYFLLHPITMVIYGFEISNTAITLRTILEAFRDRFIHAFYFHMMPMAIAFIVIGGIAGLIFGLYFRRIRRQDHEIQIQQHQLKKSIGSIIKNGENEGVEFKKSFRYDSRIGNPVKSIEDLVIHSVAGFLNVKGGILIIGVDKDCRIKGLADDYFSLGKKSREGFEKKFMEVISTKLGIDICSLVHMAFHEIGDMEICSVYVEKSHRPVYFMEGEKPVFYVRTGIVTKPLNTKETVDYLKINEQL
jgi:hypothetical protein